MEKEWENFLKLKKKTEFKGLETVSITLRIPKELKKIIIEDLRSMEDIEEKMSFNEYVLLMIMKGANINQYAEQEFKRAKTKGLEKYLNDKKK